VEKKNDRSINRDKVKRKRKTARLLEGKNSDVNHNKKTTVNEKQKEGEKNATTKYRQTETTNPAKKKIASLCPL